MQQFGRQVELYLGNKDESIVITDLRIAFNVIKTQSEEANPGSIYIYNLNPDNRHKLISKEYTKTILSVGYSEVTPIYMGDIVEATQIRDGPDIITMIEIGDGINDILGATVNTTLKAGATDTDIFDEAFKDMTRTDRGVIDITNQRQLPRGRVLTGNSRDILNRIARNSNADWSIQNNHIVFIPKDKYIESDNEGFLISEKTGMIGSPCKTQEGLEVSCLLNPKLEISNLVRIESLFTNYNGDYKLTYLEHEGDTHSDLWNSNFVCIGGEFQKAES